MTYSELWKWAHSFVYEKQEMVYKVPIKQQFIKYIINSKVSPELYDFLSNKKNKGFDIPQTTFVDIEDIEIWNIEIIQEKIEWKCLCFKNLRETFLNFK